MNKYIFDFEQLPTSLAYAFDEPDDKISVINKLVNQCISEHAPMKRPKFTRSLAPWMNDPKIFKAKNVLDNLWTKPRNFSHSHLTVCQNYQNARNHYKKQLLRKKLLSCGSHQVLVTQKKCGRQITIYLIYQKNVSISILRALINIL